MAHIPFSSVNSIGGPEYRVGAALIASLVLHAAAMTLPLPVSRFAEFEAPAPPLTLRWAKLPPLSPPAAGSKLLPAPAAPSPHVPASTAPKAGPAPLAPTKRSVGPKQRPGSTSKRVQAPEAMQAPEPVPAEAPASARAAIADPAVPATVASPAPPVAYVPSAAPPSPAPAAEWLAGYGKTISQTLARYKEYPRIAQMRGWEGAVTMELHVSQSGRMLRARLHSSSGYSVLDEQALAMATRAQPFPAPPEGLPEAEIAVLVPVVFRLTP